ncbi:MAG: type II toxin-antitoxin system PemK/MazF family toxin [Candidatus Gracilibacteria bacterium]|nr:type II toxin-antitoxin system PemK/MazF family toxin [Candidatus Gracilibacteria bacterium]MDQ7022726.1 type II toxin-antitoxin system PemK/MazF family toxin [Candidatus Gracilibacteria bacterium]
MKNNIKSKIDENEKLFDSWGKVKKNIDKKERNNFHIRPKEVWYVNMGKNIGYESNGKSGNFERPVLVLNRIGTMFFIISMTTKGKDNKFYYKLDNNYFGKDSFLTFSQFKTIDHKRFIKKIGKINNNDFIEIKKEFKNIIFKL